MISELESAGLMSRDVYSIFRGKDISTRIEIILKWLPEVYNEHLGTGDTLAHSLISDIETFISGLLINKSCN
jgi:oligoribonuclease (3'-5' exoribonuclease)